MLWIQIVASVTEGGELARLKHKNRRRLLRPSPDFGYTPLKPRSDVQGGGEHSVIDEAWSSFHAQ